ncbi:hypothetical protein HOD05_04655 [Candidatus Woesearchaeota archaeon]|jgi:hypothetical protein|nr:hypothetical protein [Candidatus Woesearchaeota archaeon]MBT4150445.1 hypothetical protein [Candidatus Woesearchaeota archaeon]MBT4247646.1 hypothetical protein [Candidatus Woesearchaeota archaeon]MBT4434481.1 hypothetical protein [Candidatus Woesearchaeota archaeon]MBT7331665.1 hypothetical protein [Candidatus Woesearchaeota archaeon]
MKINKIIGYVVAGLAALTISSCEREYTPANPVVHGNVVTHEDSNGGIAIYQFHTRRDEEIKGATFIKQFKNDRFGQKTLAGHYQDLNKNGKVDEGDFCFVSQGENCQTPLEDRFVCSTHILRTVHTDHPMKYDASNQSEGLTEDGTYKTYTTAGMWHLRNGVRTPHQSIEQAKDCIKECPSNLLEKL